MSHPFRDGDHAPAGLRRGLLFGAPVAVALWLLILFLVWILL